MARGNATAQTAANNAAGNSQAIFSDIAPTLEAQAANPQGYSPADLASMETGAQQSAGGSQAGAVGQGGLLAARTRNAGGAARAVTDSSRGAGEQLSKNLLGIRTGNAELKAKQQQSAEQGLTGLVGTEQNSIAPLVNANTGAANESWNWAKDILDPLISAGGNVGAAAVGG